MGNSTGKKVNKKLGVPIIGKLQTAYFVDSSPYKQVLGCYVLYPDPTIQHPFGRLFNVVVVTPASMGLYCLLTGEKRHVGFKPSHGHSILCSAFTSEGLTYPQIIICETNGSFAVINPFTLIIEKRFGLTDAFTSFSSKKDQVLTMILTTPDILYVGYLSGIVKVWHQGGSEALNVFGIQYEYPAVQSICYSSKHRKVIIGYDGYQESEKQPIKLENNPIRIFIPNASGSNNDCSVLEPFVGSCLSISLIERLDVIVTISSELSGVFIWDLVKQELLIKSSLPKLEKYPQVIMKTLIIERPESNYIILGSSDGTAIIAEIKKTDSQICFKPVKKIVMRLDGCFGISFINYEKNIDTLIMGNTSSTCTFLSNFFVDEFHEQLSTEIELKIDEEI